LESGVFEEGVTNTWRDRGIDTSSKIFKEWKKRRILMVAGALFGTAVGILGVLLLYLTYRRLSSVIRIFTASEVSAIDFRSGSASGQVCVQGTAAPSGATITAPVSGEDAVFFHVRAKYHSRQNSPRWRTFTNEFESVPFAIQTETGQIPVHLGAGDGEVGRRVHNPGPVDTERKVPVDELNDRQDEFLRTDGGEEKFNQKVSRLADKPIKLLEERVEPGETVYLHGSVMKADGGETVLAADRITSSRYEGIVTDIGKSIFFGLFGAFLCLAFLLVGLPSLKDLLLSLL
jgi:hypothetical protein